MRHEVEQQQQRLVEQNHNSLPVATPSLQDSQSNSCTLGRKNPFVRLDDSGLFWVSSSAAGSQHMSQSFKCEGPNGWPSIIQRLIIFSQTEHNLTLLWRGRSRSRQKCVCSSLKRERKLQTLTQICSKIFPRTFPEALFYLMCNFRITRHGAAKSLQRRKLLWHIYIQRRYTQAYICMLIYNIHKCVIRHNIWK